MANKKLVNYFKKGLSRGYTVPQLKQALLKQGYSSNEINEAIKLFKQGNNPSRRNLPISSAQKVTKPNPAQKNVWMSGRNAKNSQKDSNATQSNPANSSVKNPQTAGVIKKRNPVLVLLFSILSLGIYGIVWTVFTTNELRRSGKSAPNPWLLLTLIVPVVNFLVMLFYWFKYSKAINELTGFSTAGLFLIWVLFSPAGMIVSQIQLNKKA